MPKFGLTCLRHAHVVPSCLDRQQERYVSIYTSRGQRPIAHALQLRSARPSSRRNRKIAQVRQRESLQGALGELNGPISLT